MTKKAVIELSGRVKWFDPKKGYGFLVCDGIGGDVMDVMLHHSVLREHGRRELPEGAELVAEAFLSDRGFQVEKVISIDLRGAVPPRPAAPSKTRSTSLPHGEAGPFEAVQVKWFDPAKGFGFLVRGDDDVFVHAAHFRRAALPFPENGDLLEATIAHGGKGLIAVDVRAVQQPQAIAA